MGKKAGEIVSCSRCGKIYAYQGYGAFCCEDCKKKEEEDFQKVKEYIETHGAATMLEVAEKTGVSARQVEQFLRDNRLEIPEGMPSFMKCEDCGASIRTGRFCHTCALKLSDEIHPEEKKAHSKEIVLEKSTKKRERMRYFNQERE